MKVILSRKGFDSKHGGIPSPIFPDGRIISFPIPAKNDRIFYSDLQYKKNENLYDLINSIQQSRSLENKIQRKTSCHLDPDLYKSLIKRNSNWVPLFGQKRASQTHLDNFYVSIGDLFLFFGWFRRIKQVNNQYKYFGPNLHIIFGYLQIGSIVKDKKDLKNWMLYHPHARYFDSKTIKNNALYVARKTLSWNNKLSGASPFNYFNNNLVLTQKDEKDMYYSRSKWFFTKDFFKNRIAITHHSKDNWKSEYFQSSNIGQEFVIEENNSVKQWAKEIIKVSLANNSEGSS